MTDAKVLIVMGSASDKAVMEDAAKVLAELGISARMTIASAHRTPDRATALARDARGQGVKVIIAGAGYAAHLGGVLAAHTTLPVIGVPLDASSLKGLDSLLATVQMPSGIPVATVTIGKSGARNAGILAAQMLAISDDALAKKLEAFRAAMTAKVDAADAELQST